MPPNDGTTTATGTPNRARTNFTAAVEAQWRDSHNTIVGTSRIRLEQAITLRPVGVSTVVLIGTVTSGLFTGDLMTYSEVLTPQPLLGCVTTGVTSQSGVSLGLTLE